MFTSSSRLGGIRLSVLQHGEIQLEGYEENLLKQQTFAFEAFVGASRTSLQVVDVYSPSGLSFPIIFSPISEFDEFSKKKNN